MNKKNRYGRWEHTPSAMQTAILCAAFFSDPAHTFVMQCVVCAKSAKASTNTTRIRNAAWQLQPGAVHDAN